MIEFVGGSDSEVVLDLCGRRLKRLEKAPANQAYATALVLDNNQLQNLANLDSYGELERVGIGKSTLQISFHNTVPYISNQ